MVSSPVAAPMFQPLAIHNQSICVNLVWTCSINPHKPKLHWQQSVQEGIATLATKLSAKGQNNAQFVKLLVQLTAAARLPTLLIFNSLPLSLDFWNLSQGHDSIFGSKLPIPKQRLRIQKKHQGCLIGHESGNWLSLSDLGSRLFYFWCWQGLIQETFPQGCYNSKTSEFGPIPLPLENSF